MTDLVPSRARAEATADGAGTIRLLIWVAAKAFLLLLLLDATETVVLYQNY